MLSPSTRKDRRAARYLGWALEAVALFLAWLTWDYLFQTLLSILTFAFAILGGCCLLGAWWEERKKDERRIEEDQ